MMLNKPPPIFVIGFIPTDKGDDDDPIPDYDIDFTIDISPFTTEVNPYFHSL